MGSKNQDKVTYMGDYLRKSLDRGGKIGKDFRSTFAIDQSTYWIRSRSTSRLRNHLPEFFWPNARNYSRIRATAYVRSRQIDLWFTDIRSRFGAQHVCRKSNRRRCRRISTLQLDLPRTFEILERSFARKGHHHRRFAVPSSLSQYAQHIHTKICRAWTGKGTITKLDSDSLSDLQIKILQALHRLQRISPKFHRNEFQLSELPTEQRPYGHSSADCGASCRIFLAEENFSEQERVCGETETQNLTQGLEGSIR